jgi:7-cyano-7-deazaguanine reductase
MSHGLKALAASAANTQYKFDHPAPELLERFTSPFTGGATGTLHIEAPEFTSLCPLTGQPDFATIVIDYRPGLWCVESKALKLYLNSFRNHGEFHEACVTRIATDLNRLLEPGWIIVEGRFTPRGGIPFWPVASFHSGENADDPDFLYARLGRFQRLGKGL